MTEQTSHAKYSASSTYRWFNCPGSIRLIEKAPPQPDSEYAKEGTEAHACLEYLLKERDAPRTSQAMAKMEYGEEMLGHCLTVVAEVERRLKEASESELLIEHKGNLDWIGPDMGGTNDIAIIDIFGRLTVIDFKYGAGVPVEVEENEQMLTYALQLAHLYDYNFSEVCLVVAQPRAPHEKGPIREWICSVDHLKAFGEKIRSARKACEKKDAPLVSGEWCRFCPAKIICSEVSTKAMAQAQLVFDEVGGNVLVPRQELLRSDSGQTKQFDLSKLRNILDAKKAVLSYFDAVEKYAIELLEKGKPVPGWKLVAGRATRKWTDPVKTAKEARAAFGKKAFSEPELLSPAQLEKLKDVNEKWIDKRVSKVSTTTTLVPESDSRPSITKAALIFDEVPEKKSTTTSRKPRR